MPRGPAGVLWWPRLLRRLTRRAEPHESLRPAFPASTPDACPHDWDDAFRDPTDSLHGAPPAPTRPASRPTPRSSRTSTNTYGTRLGSLAPTAPAADPRRRSPSRPGMPF